MNKDDFKKIILDEMYFTISQFKKYNYINNNDFFIEKMYIMMNNIENRINTYKLNNGSELSLDYISNELNKFAEVISKCSNIKVKRTAISVQLRLEVFKRDGYRCKICGATNKDSKLEIDHIIPISEGGTDELSNLQTLCKECNISKSNKIFVT